MNALLQRMKLAKTFYADKDSDPIPPRIPIKQALLIDCNKRIQYLLLLIAN